MNMIIDRGEAEVDSHIPKDDIFSSPEYVVLSELF